MNKARRFIPFCVLALMSPLAISQNHAAHVHGLADLTMALEQGILELQLVSPAANLVGFEHKAESKKEIESAKRTATALSQPTSLFKFVGTKCKLLSTNADISAVHQDKHSEHNHGEHEHEDEKHAHDDHEHKEDDHSEHEHHEDEHSAEHSDITASYRFRCDQSNKLQAIDLELFSLFAGLEKVNAMWVTEGGQGASTLTPSKPTLVLKN